jgi:hypothetical protein
MMPGNTSTLARSKTGLRYDIHKTRFPFCTPKVFHILAKKTKTGSGIKYDETKFACDYLCLHCYSCKIIQRTTCHASEAGIQSFLETIFHGPMDAKEARLFINNKNMTMLVTRRTYANPSTYTDDVVALLSWTGHNKPVVYIGWAAVSGGQLHLPSPLADSTSPTYGFPDRPGLPQPLPKGFTRLGLMTVMLELMELATCHYKKIKSMYIYLHVNPTESATNTSSQPFWTKRGFDPVDETLVIVPLTATEDKNPLLIHRHTFKTTAQTEVLAGLKELREHLIVSPNDGKKSDTDKGMVTYSRAHQNACPAVHTLTDAAQEAILSEAARVPENSNTPIILPMVTPGT